MYSKLYKSEEVDINFQREFFNKIDQKICEEDRDAMDADFSESELFESLKSLQDNKSPGFDGLTKEFYVFFWDQIKLPYLKAIDAVRVDK